MKSQKKQVPFLDGSNWSNIFHLSLQKTSTAIAAAIVLLCMINAFWLLERTQVDATQIETTQVLPAQERAILTLADGRSIDLDSAVSGILLQDDAIRIERSNDGQIQYSVQGEIKAKGNNNIRTPRAGTYSIVLPDGTKAWLNAESSLTYPVQFSDQERRVSMTGEVFFQVTKQYNKKKALIPFYVMTKDQEVEVLGTQFNIRAYPNEEESRAILAKGSIRVRSLRHAQTVLLNPGEQAVIADDLRVLPADLESQLAWKEGDFIFHEEPLSKVLPMLARWYDVSYSCPKELEGILLSGMLSRRQPLTTVISSIAATHQTNLILKERRIIVSKRKER